MSLNAITASPPIHQLSIKKAFNSLSDREKLYAHHLSRYVVRIILSGWDHRLTVAHGRAAWHGARIILRQVSPESIGIYEFILELNSTCSGDWKVLVDEGLISQEECDALLNYAATFLSNIGNYYVSTTLEDPSSFANIKPGTW